MRRRFTVLDTLIPSLARTNVPDRWIRAVYPHSGGRAGANDRRVAYCLADLARGRPSVSVGKWRLCQMAGIAFSTAGACLRRLEEEGFLSVAPPSRAGHAPTYSLLIPEGVLFTGPSLAELRRADQVVPVSHPAFTSRALGAAMHTLLVNLSRGLITRSGLMEATGWSRPTLQRQLDRARAEGLVSASRLRANGRSMEVFALVDGLKESLLDVAKKYMVTHLPRLREARHRYVVERLQRLRREIPQDPSACKHETPCCMHGGPQGAPMCGVFTCVPSWAYIRDELMASMRLAA